jgi:hypothetical protein
MFPLYTGLAKQNSINFNIAGRLAALLCLLKYYVHFSWDRREKNSNFFLNFLLHIFEGDKNHQNIW